MMPAGSGRPRALVLTQVFEPEPNFITGDVARALCRDYDVTVVTAHPNYPFDHFYPEVRRPWWPGKTVEHGVTVWRVPMWPYHGRSKAKRGLAYLSFVACATALLALGVARRPSLVWVYHGPFTVLLAALWFRVVSRARLVLTVADLWPESFVAAGVAEPGLVMRVMFAYRRWTNRFADLIVCSTRGTLEQFRAEGMPADRLVFVPVWVEGSESAPAAEDVGRQEAAPIVYAGNIGPAQGLDTAVRAAAELRRRGVPVRFEFFGSGSSEDGLKALATELGADNVRFNGRRAPEEVFAISSRAFAQLVSLTPSPLFAMTIPSKISFCCAASAPVLYGLPGESARIMAETGGALAFTPGEPDTLVAAVEQLLAMDHTLRQALRKRLRAYYEEHFARGRLIARYQDLLRPGG
jgi:glycosyltransferase involved in cell wall biosynthesis